MPGPVPKRSDQLVRRNLPETPITKVEIHGEVEVPELGFDDPHPLVQDLYDSLRNSGQARYYEPSDWEYARFTLHFADKLLKSPKPSSMMLASVNTMLTDLLLSEGSRRKVRLEVERKQDQPEGKVLQVADLFRERLMNS